MIFKKIMESLLALIIGLLAAYGLVCLYALTFGDRLLFTTQDCSYSLDSDFLTTTSRLGHTIPLIYLKTPEAKYTILYSHGNLEDLGFIRPRLETFHKHGFNVLGYDYPGFGVSKDKKSEENAYDAAEAAYIYLTKTLGIPPEKIILYGRSMGGGPTAYLASHHKVAGVVMHSTFVSAYRVQTGVQLLPWDRFENLKKIPQIQSPIFFVHGLSDETIPIWHTRMMMEKAKSPTMSLLVPYALHNNVIEIAREDYWESLENFIALVDKFNEPLINQRSIEKTEIALEENFSKQEAVEKQTKTSQQEKSDNLNSSITDSTGDE